MSGSGPAGVLATLARHAATYAAGDVLLRAAAFLLLPLYTRKLSVEAFGVLGLVAVLEAGFVLVVNLGLPTAVLRRLADDGPPAGRDLFSAFSVVVGCTLGAIGVMWGFQGPVRAAVFGSGVDLELFGWVLAGLGLASVKLFGLSVLRAEGKAAAYAGVNAFHFVLLVGLSVFFVVGLDQGLDGAVRAQTLAGGAAFAALVPVLVRRLQPRWRRAGAGALLGFGAPLMLGMFASWVLSMSNRFFIQHLDGSADVGVYTLGFRVAFVVRVALVTPFRTAWVPALFSLAGREDAGDLRRVVHAYLSAALSFSVLGVLVFAPVLVHVLGTDAYAEAVGVARLLAIGHLLSGFYFVADNGVLLGGRTRLYPVVTGASALVALALYAILVPAGGILGAALATVAASAVLVGLMAFASHRVSPTAYGLGRVALPIGLAALLFGGWSIVVTALGLDAVSTAGVSLSIATLALFPPGLLVAGFLRARERTVLRRLISARGGRRAPSSPPDGAP